MAKYIIDIDEDNLDNNDIYCIVANAISLEKVLEDIKEEINDKAQVDALQLVCNIFDNM